MAKSPTAEWSSDCEMIFTRTLVQWPRSAWHLPFWTWTCQQGTFAHRCLGNAPTNRWGPLYGRRSSSESVLALADSPGFVRCALTSSHGRSLRLGSRPRATPRLRLGNDDKGTGGTDPKEFPVPFITISNIALNVFGVQSPLPLANVSMAVSLDSMTMSTWVDFRIRLAANDVDRFVVARAMWTPTSCASQITNHSTTTRLGIPPSR